MGGIFSRDRFAVGEGGFAQEVISMEKLLLGEGEFSTEERVIFIDII